MGLRRRTANCWCDGRGYRDKGQKWVVLQRNPAARSHLKCLRCGCKWHSRCQYVAKLRDHKERNQGGLTDDDILARLRAGTLAVCTRTAVVRSTSKYGTRVLRQEVHRPTVPRHGGVYHFVTIWYQGRKKKIAVHRLVWVAYHDRLPPPGYDVDHKKGKTGRYPHRISNLELRPSRDNSADNQYRYGDF